MIHATPIDPSGLEPMLIGALIAVVIIILCWAFTRPAPAPTHNRRRRRSTLVRATPGFFHLAE